MPRKAATPPTPDPPDTSDDTGTDDEQDEDDDIAEEFAREWEAVRDKVASIPDNLDETLQNLLSFLTGDNQHAKTANRQASGAPAQGPDQREQRSPYPASRAGDTGGIPPSDQQPQSRHWYYRERPKRNG